MILVAAGHMSLGWHLSLDWRMALGSRAHIPGKRSLSASPIVDRQKMTFMSLRAAWFPPLPRRRK
jgi:hypothetical protein